MTVLVLYTGSQIIDGEQLKREDISNQTLSSQYSVGQVSVLIKALQCQEMKGNEKAAFQKERARVRVKSS